LRGYVGEVGEIIKLFPYRTADYWTEIDKADIVGAVQSIEDGASTIIVRRDAKVLYAKAGILSGLAEAGLFGMECTEDYTGEWECRGETMYCKVIRRCSYQGPFHRHHSENEYWVACGSCGEDGLTL